VQCLQRRLADHTALAPHVGRRFRRGVPKRLWAQLRWDGHDVPRWERQAVLNLRLRVGVWSCSGTCPGLHVVGLAIEVELDGLVQVQAGQVPPIASQGVIVVLVVGGTGHVVVEHRAEDDQHRSEELVERPEPRLPAVEHVGGYQPIDNSGPRIDGPRNGNSGRHPLFLFLVV